MMSNRFKLINTIFFSYSPEYILEENVVVVTINYRLGPFGFLYLPDAGINGNAGLKDQLLAMKWVNENISQFGGDPNNVTLFGESAGAGSIHIHTFSEESRKYFHKAICQSGSSLMEWMIQKKPEEKTRKLTELVGCKEKKASEILAYLKSIKESSTIYNNWYGTLSADEKRRGLPMPFKPAVERYAPDAILTKSPLEAMQIKNSHNIPILMGYNDGEGLIMLADVYKKLDIYNKDLARMIPTSINLANEKPGNPQCIQLADEIKKFYFNSENLSAENLTDLAKLQSDYHFILGAQLTAELHAKYQQSSPMYFYRFSCDSELNLFKKLMLRSLEFAETDKLIGACHGDDIFYLFT